MRVGGQNFITFLDPFSTDPEARFTWDFKPRDAPATEAELKFIQLTTDYTEGCTESFKKRKERRDVYFRHFCGRRQTGGST